jgi:Ulp1 family protease
MAITLPMLQFRMHWSLIIVCMPTNETESGPVILHLDSLGLHPSQKLFDIVQWYVFTLNTTSEFGFEPHSSEFRSISGPCC